MIWGCGIAVIAVAIFIGGWRAHLSFCMRRNGCPIYRQLDTGEWVNRLASEGWHTKNGKRHFPREERETHPTTEVATPQTLAKALDENNKTGIPLPNTNGVTTDVANPKRRRP